MNRESTTFSIKELRGMFVDIEFPEYQRISGHAIRSSGYLIRSSVDSIFRRSTSIVAKTADSSASTVGSALMPLCRSWRRMPPTGQTMGSP